MLRRNAVLFIPLALLVAQDDFPSPPHPYKLYSPSGTEFSPTACLTPGAQTNRLMLTVYYHMAVSPVLY